jgi:hypothetical protein
VNPGPKQGWENEGAAACEELMKQEDQAFLKAKDQETAATHLKILKDGRGKLVNLAELIQTKAEDKSREKLGELNSEVLFNKS